MLFDTLPREITPFMSWTWEQIQPFADDLIVRPLTADTLEPWLADWSTLSSLISETASRLRIRTTTHTNDEAGQERFNTYVETIVPKARELDQRLKERLLASGLEPAGFEVPLRRMRGDAALFRAENLPLQTALEKLGVERSKIVGAWTVPFQGEELTFSQASARLQDPDRAVREQIWRSMVACAWRDRAKLDELWVKMLDLRLQMARNAGYDHYRAFRWQELARYDYTPQDCLAFHRAIEEVVVPAASRLYARRKALMGIDTLRVWDNFWFSSPDARNRPPLRPYSTLDELNTTIERIFTRVDPQFGAYYRTMRDEGLLDLESRKHKTGGAYMDQFLFSRRSFIFAHAVGSHDSVTTLLHEGGHAFHGFETGRHPYVQQRSMEFIPMEFLEVGSMAMELLASPYIAADQGGFYSEADAARANAEQLEGILRFWPYMSVVDSFQHWVYDNPDLARDPQQCDAQWAALHQRYLPDLDWSGVEDGLKIYWQVQGHISSAPFYYIEYGLAQLGAVQVWANALQDQAGAVAAYRRALQAGGTLTLPQLYEAAGVRLAFDAETLRRAVTLIEQTLIQLEAAQTV